MSDLRLGFRIDPATGEPGSEALTLDSDELTTHAVILGMTGSGKTGLGIVLLEEALLAGVPALVLDPKGDMGNLLLTFPDLSPESFRPWVSEDEARREGLSPEAFAEQVATRWREGLERHGIGPERIRALRDAADFVVYTPGSEAGVPLDMLGSLSVPSLSWETEAEALREQIESTAVGLLGLVGIDADPLSSREAVLVSNLIEHAWREGRSLSLGELIGLVQSPPFRKLGVFDVDTFFPRDARVELALKLNALAASPTFAAWGTGQALDPGTLLRTPDGKPRAAIVYLAHLSDEQRQLAVTLVLSRLVTWMRSQSGTESLRTLVYMDEVFGFVPPTAVPPAKKPILTLLKTGRAFGVGMVLATQNPVDLDYKAMSNAGTWLVGRLQTQNDKERVLEGLRSAAGGADIAALDAAIGALEKRRFLLVSARSSEPALFETRWAMSYLRGPLTKDQIAQLTSDELRARTEPVGAAAEAPPPAPVADATPVAPPVAPGVPVRYLDPAAPWASSVGAAAGGRALRAFLAARVRVRFDDARAGVDEVQEYEALYGPLDGSLDVASGRAVDYDERDFGGEAPEGASYVLPGVPLEQASFFRGAEREIQRHVRGSLALELRRNRRLGLVSRPGEDPEAFARRCDEAAQAAADEEAAKIRERLERRAERLHETLAEAQERLAELTAEQRALAQDELIAGAGAVLDSLLGGRRSTRSIASAVRRAEARKRTAASRARSAQAKVARAQEDLRELEQEILDEVAEIDERWGQVATEIETIAIRPDAGDVHVEELALVWVPTSG